MSMFIKNHTDKSKTFRLQAYKPGKRIPVFSAQSLLADKKHQFFIQQASELSALPREHFDAFYKVFIHRFVEFVQVLPTQNSDPLCGLMNEGLLRGINVLHQLIIKYKHATPLERYAVFTAAVLGDVANAVVNQKIFITDEQGAFVKEWRPFEGSLTDDKEAEYYKIMPLSSTYYRLRYAITPLLARQLLPKKGFEWISGDMRIFADWLDALRGEDAEGAGRMAHTLQLFRTKPEGFIDSLPAITVNLEESSETKYGDAFFEWLKEGLANGSIKVNTSDANVHVMSEGVFIEKAGIFKQYIDLHGNLPVNMFSVFQQFGNLFGLTKLSGNDYRIDQLFSEYPDAGYSKSNGFSSPLSAKKNATREGVMLPASMVFVNGETPASTPYLKSLPASQRTNSLPDLGVPMGQENRLK